MPALNGKLPSDEATRYAYLLKEIRSAIESEQAAVDVTPPVTPAITVIVTPIRSGTYLSIEDVQKVRAGEPPVLLEALAAPETPAETPSEAVERPEDTTVVHFPARRSGPEITRQPVT